MGVGKYVEKNHTESFSPGRDSADLPEPNQCLIAQLRMHTVVHHTQLYTQLYTRGSIFKCPATCADTLWLSALILYAALMLISFAKEYWNWNIRILSQYLGNAWWVLKMMASLWVKIIVFSFLRLLCVLLFSLGCFAFARKCSFKLWRRLAPLNRVGKSSWLQCL